MSCDCCEAFPCGAMGLSAVCDCGDHTHLLFYIVRQICFYYKQLGSVHVFSVLIAYLQMPIINATSEQGVKNLV